MDHVVERRAGSSSNRADERHDSRRYHGLQQRRFGRDGLRLAKASQQDGHDRPIRDAGVCRGSSVPRCDRLAQRSGNERPRRSDATGVRIGQAFRRGQTTRGTQLGSSAAFGGLVLLIVGKKHSRKRTRFARRVRFLFKPRVAQWKSVGEIIVVFSVVLRAPQNVVTASNARCGHGRRLSRKSSEERSLYPRTKT